VDEDAWQHMYEILQDYQKHNSCDFVSSQSPSFSLHRMFNHHPCIEWRTWLVKLRGHCPTMEKDALHCSSKLFLPLIWVDDAFIVCKTIMVRQF
jgi:hypothetical protein